MAPDEDANSERRVQSKVARLIDTYGLGQQYGDKLEDRWTAEGDRRESLRALADRFNKRLLETAMTEAGLGTVDGDVDNMYRLLTEDEVSSGNRTEARRRLETNGVAVEQLETDFVTYQAIRSYLKEYRGAEYDDDTETTRTERVVQTIQRLKSRTHSVTADSLDQLRETDRLTLGEFRLFVDISVLCEECDTQYEVVELLKRGGCDCHTE